MQSKLPLIVAIIFGLIAFVGIGQYLQSRNKPVAMQMVLVSTSNKKRDSKIERADIGSLAVPADMVRGLTGIYRPGDESVSGIGSRCDPGVECRVTVAQALPQFGFARGFHVQRIDQ